MRRLLLALLIGGAGPALAERQVAWGPAMSTGLPVPAVLGFDLRLGRHLGFGMAGGRFQGRVPIPDGESLGYRLQTMEIETRWFPLQGGLYAETGVGRQQVVVAGERLTTLRQDDVELDFAFAARMELVSWYVAPRLGYIWHEGRRLHIASSLGLQIPFHSEATFSARFSDDPFLDESFKSTNSYRNLQQDLLDAGRKAGLLGLPSLRLIKLSWWFP